MEELVTEAFAIVLFMLLGGAVIAGIINMFMHKAEGVSVSRGLLCSFAVPNSTNATYVYVSSNVTFPIWVFVYVNATSAVYGPYNQTLVVIGNVSATRVVVQDDSGLTGVCVYHE